MHGGDIYKFARERWKEPESVLDFSANMNDFIQVRNMKINSVYIKNYPEVNLEFYKSIVSEHKFKNENVTIIPGLTFFIHNYMAGLDGNVIVISPTFTEYMYAATAAHRIILPFDVINKNPEIIENYSFDTLFLVYPDNPTGQIVNKKNIIKILDICVKKNARLFLDESFIWFVNNRELDEAQLIESYPNLIIGRSLTKILSVPGLRLAYVISSNNNISRIEKNLEPWRISQPALLYLRACNMNFNGIPEIVEKERNYVIKSMESINIKLIGSPKANFATFKLPTGINGRDMKKFLAEREIMIRLLDDYQEFGINYIRISIKKHGKNTVLIRSIREYIGDRHD